MENLEKNFKIFEEKKEKYYEEMGKYFGELFELFEKTDNLCPEKEKKVKIKHGKIRLEYVRKHMYEYRGRKRIIFSIGRDTMSKMQEHAVCHYVGKKWVNLGKITNSNRFKRALDMFHKIKEVDWEPLIVEKATESIEWDVDFDVVKKEPEPNKCSCGAELTALMRFCSQCGKDVYVRWGSCTNGIWRDYKTRIDQEIEKIRDTSYRGETKTNQTFQAYSTQMGFVKEELFKKDIQPEPQKEVKKRCVTCKYSIQNNPNSKACDKNYPEISKKCGGLGKHDSWEEYIKPEPKTKKICKSCRFASNNNSNGELCGDNYPETYKKCRYNSEWVEYVKPEKSFEKDIHSKPKTSDCGTCIYSHKNNSNGSTCGDNYPETHKKCDGRFFEWREYIKPELRKICANCKHSGRYNDYFICQPQDLFGSCCSDKGHWKPVERSCDTCGNKKCRPKATLPKRGSLVCDYPSLPQWKPKEL